MFGCWEKFQENEFLNREFSASRNKSGYVDLSFWFSFVFLHFECHVICNCYCRKS